MPSTIRRGSKGSDVVKCQEALIAKGYKLTADGDFGGGTEKIVMQFQKAQGLGADGVVGQGTWSKLLAGDSAPKGSAAPSPIPPVIAHAQSLGHKVWGDPWRLWLFGIRSKSRNANAFDDTFGCAYVDDKGLWQVSYWPATTDPGTHWLLNPMNSAGCAILVPGQYLDTWKIGKHGGKYDALTQQAGEVKVYRDGSKDNKLDLDPKTIMSGYFGINLHAATQREDGVSTNVDKWSAGCQVHASDAGFDQMMDLAKKQQSKTSRDTFSYTLMDQWW